MVSLAYKWKQGDKDSLAVSTLLFTDYFPTTVSELD